MLLKVPDKIVLPDPVCSERIAAAYLLKEWWYEHGWLDYSWTLMAERGLLE